MIPALLVGFALYWLQQLPQDQEIRVRLPEGSLEPRRVTLAIRPDGEREILAGTALSFSDSAPDLVSHRVSLPNGVYVIEIELAGSPLTDESHRMAFSRRVHLEGGVTTVRLDP